MSSHERAIQLLDEDCCLNPARVQEMRQNLLDPASAGLPMLVLTVFGVPRSGKSTLLLLLLRNLLGEDWAIQVRDRDAVFETASSDTAVTCGLWAWSKPVVVTHVQTGRRYRLVLLDCEGSDRADALAEVRAARVVAIAAAVSNRLVYHLKENLDHVHVRQLGRVAASLQRLRAEVAGLDEAPELAVFASQVRPSWLEQERSQAGGLAALFASKCSPAGHREDDPMQLSRRSIAETWPFDNDNRAVLIAVVHPGSREESELLQQDDQNPVPSLMELTAAGQPATPFRAQMLEVFDALIAPSRRQSEYSSGEAFIDRLEAAAEAAGSNGPAMDVIRDGPAAVLAWRETQVLNAHNVSLELTAELLARASQPAIAALDAYDPAVRDGTEPFMIDWSFDPHAIELKATELLGLVLPPAVFATWTSELVSQVLAASEAKRRELQEEANEKRCAACLRVDSQRTARGKVDELAQVIRQFKFDFGQSYPHLRRYDHPCAYTGCDRGGTTGWWCQNCGYHKHCAPLHCSRTGRHRSGVDGPQLDVLLQQQVETEQRMRVRADAIVDAESSRQLVADAAAAITSIENDRRTYQQRVHDLTQIKDPCSIM